MPKSYRFTVEAPGQRLDRYLADRLPDLTRSYVKKLADDGMITVDGRWGKPSLKLKAGEEVALVVPDPQPLDLRPEDIPLAVAYEDDDVLVVDKPAGLTVHPGPGHPSHTLVNAVLARCPDLAGIKGTTRPGIVHRLDKDTSGLIVVAKNDAAHQALARQFKERSVTKRYVALARGNVGRESGVIDAPLARDPRNRKRMAVVAGGREARTAYRVVERFQGATLVEVTPETGRTHQIRAHFASIRHPLVGDLLYGGRSASLGRQFLHAAELTFAQPRTGQLVRCAAPLPPDLEEALRAWRDAGQP